MKKVKEERGITLISLTITILVMTVLTVTLTASLNSTTELKRFNEVKSDVLALSQEVKAYYLKNGTLPVRSIIEFKYFPKSLFMFLYKLSVFSSISISQPIQQLSVHLSALHLKAS